MKRILVRAALLCLALLCLPLLSQATFASEVAEVESILDFQLILADEAPMTLAKASKVVEEADWLLPEFAPAGTQFFCTAPPPSCVCGRCCECFICWQGGVTPVFGCDR